MIRYVKLKLAKTLPRQVTSWLIKCRDKLMYNFGIIKVLLGFYGIEKIDEIKKQLMSTPSESVSVLFYPEIPKHKSVAYKLCILSGYEMTHKSWNNFDICIWYENRTFSKYKFEKGKIRLRDEGKEEDVWFENQNSVGGLKKINNSDGKKVINRSADSISKEKVGNIFHKVFGYRINISPTNYGGKIVAKPNTNGAHTGEVLVGPLSESETEEGIVYQKEIKNEDGEGQVEDLRVPVFGNDLPFVYSKKRPIKKRFSNRNTRVDIKPTYRIFSKDETSNIIEFSNKMGLDFGEIDVLRDQRDGRIYIVDVNNTPWGPPNGLATPQRRRALELLRNSFQELIADRIS
jgi:hypothetical protein